MASTSFVQAPLSTSGVSGRRFSGEVLREAPELRCSVVLMVGDGVGDGGAPK